MVGVGEWFDGLLIVFEGRPRGRPLRLVKVSNAPLTHKREMW